MGWLDDWLTDLGPTSPAIAAKPVAVPRKPKLEIKTVWITTRSPRDGDAGCAECGHYSVADNVVTMRDENGKATGKSRLLAPGDDPHQIAGRMTREAWSANQGGNFNRPLHYQKCGVA